jgi:hypothetical protein
MKKTILGILIFLCLSFVYSYANDDWMDSTSVVCPDDGHTNRVLIMLPGHKAGKKASGKFYDISDDGEFRIRWKIDWYSDASNVFIREDSLVRIRETIREPHESLDKFGERPLLEFYKKGVLIKSYRVIDLCDIGKHFGISNPVTRVHNVFALHEQLSPKAVKRLEYEVNTLEQYRIIERKAIDMNDIFKVDVIDGDRIFFRISTGEILHRFKYNYTDRGRAIFR